MLNLKSVALGAAFLGTAATMTLTAASAQAATIEGSIVGFGVSEATGDLTINFGQGFTQSNGAFSDLNGFTTINDLVLSPVSGDTYSYQFTDPFMTFTNLSTFDLNAGLANVVFTTMADGSTEVEVDLSPITGPLNAPDGSFRVGLTGSLSLSDSGLDDPASFGSYQYDLKAVPEPLTMLGAGAAIAFGGAFKRKLGKKSGKGSTKA